MNYRVAAGVLVLTLTGPFGFAHADESLSGTAWQLVEIVSMNDTVDSPDDASLYTLAFGKDGTVAMRADCNRGAGSWTSEGSQLKFGPIASTRALCPPGSLSEKYLAQFEWVRSYVMEDGHLFLATMADGSMIEFAPNSAATATVFDEEIRSADADVVQEAILTRLFDRYAADNGIEAEPSEINAFLEGMNIGMAKKGLTSDKDLSAEEAEAVAAMRRDMARSMIRQWKINKALYEKYGGRIFYQQLGPEPLDAYRQFLEEQQREGAFTILDKSLEDDFWRYFTDESIHDFMKPGSEDEVRAFSKPPWQSSN